MNKKIYFVDQTKKDEINDLRVQEYAKVNDFVVDLSTLNWSAADDESFVMAAQNEEQLIATMRGEVINDRSLLEKKLECPWDFAFEIDEPVLLLSRAATHSSHRRIGLNLILRYWFLRFALSNNINFIIGTFVSGSTREHSLREMGYQFFENNLGWQQSTYRSLRPITVVALNLKLHKDKALEYCMNHMSNTHNEYYFEGELPRVRTVRSL